MRITYETGNQTECAKISSRVHSRAFQKTEGIDMWRNVTKTVAVMALAVIVAGSTSSVASAHHGRGHRVVVQNPPVCYADGSCDIDGVCTLGVDCDGSVHHAGTYYYSGSAHHGGYHH